MTRRLLRPLSDTAGNVAEIEECVDEIFYRENARRDRPFGRQRTDHTVCGRG